MIYENTLRFSKRRVFFCCPQGHCHGVVGIGVPADPNDISSRDDISQIGIVAVFVGADDSVRPGAFSFFSYFLCAKKVCKDAFKREGISISLPS